VRRRYLEAGGPLIAPETLEAEKQKFIGSVLLVQAESLDAVRKIVEEDVYWTSGVVCAPSLFAF
jgi:uncharacterized protein